MLCLWLKINLERYKLHQDTDIVKKGSSELKVHIESLTIKNQQKRHLQ